MATGWAFDVSVEYVGGGWSPAQVWHVAIADQAEAEAALKAELAFTPDTTKVEARAQLSENSLKGIGLEPGKAKRWI